MVVEHLGQEALSNWERVSVERCQPTLGSLLRVQGLIQNVYHCSSADRGKQVLYIIPSAVEDHYIFYYEGKIHRHHFRVAKLMGESHGCEMGQGLSGVRSLAVVVSPSPHRCLISCAGKDTLSAPSIVFLIPCSSRVGRDPDINQQALEDFQNAVRAGGLNPENIFIPKQSGRNQAAMFSPLSSPPPCKEGSQSPRSTGCLSSILSFRGGRDPG